MLGGSGITLQAILYNTNKGNYKIKASNVLVHVRACYTSPMCFFTQNIVFWKTSTIAPATRPLHLIVQKFYYNLLSFMFNIVNLFLSYEICTFLCMKHNRKVDVVIFLKYIKRKIYILFMTNFGRKYRNLYYQILLNTI